MPTMMEAIGAPIPLQCDGLSLAPFLAGRAPAAWREEAHWEFDFRDVGDDSAEQTFGLTLHQCALNVVRGARYKYVHFTGLPPLFFDLEADPGETAQPGRRSGLRAAGAAVRPEAALLAHEPRRADAHPPGAHGGRRPRPSITPLWAPPRLKEARLTPPLGIIEGYYGRPWTWDMREEQARFFAARGYSSYIYAPKADKRLRKQWREDHPADEADRLARMAGVCAGLGMGFGVGLSPYEAYGTSMRRRRSRWPARSPSSTPPAAPSWPSCSTT